MLIERCFWRLLTISKGLKMMKIRTSAMQHGKKEPQTEIRGLRRMSLTEGWFLFFPQPFHEASRCSATSPHPRLVQSWFRSHLQSLGWHGSGPIYGPQGWHEPMARHNAVCWPLEKVTASPHLANCFCRWLCCCLRYLLCGMWFMLPAIRLWSGVLLDPSDWCRFTCHLNLWSCCTWPELTSMNGEGKTP